MKDNSIHAGNLLKELLTSFGGRGGGKPNFAQGGVPGGVGSQDVIDKLAELLN
jgi:alanyl-tRNA synthetase